MKPQPTFILEQQTLRDGQFTDWQEVSRFVTRRDAIEFARQNKIGQVWRVTVSFARAAARAA